MALGSLSILTWSLRDLKRVLELLLITCVCRLGLGENIEKSLGFEDGSTPLESLVESESSVDGGKGKASA